MTRVREPLISLCLYLTPFVPMPPDTPAAVQKEYPWVLIFDHGDKWEEVEMFREKHEAERQLKVWRELCNDVEFRIVHVGG